MLTLDAPASKSMTQRALVIAALADGVTRIQRPLRCDDTRLLGELLRSLGCEVAWGNDEVAVRPAPLRAPAGPILCGNAGTAARFGACLSLVCQGALTIDGDARMRARPIGALGSCLQRMGVEVMYAERDGYPPLRLQRRGEPQRSAQVDTSLSSQYASGLLMVAPRLPRGLALALEGDSVSRPYVSMTVAMMQAAGAQVRWRGDRRLEVLPGRYQAAAGGALCIAVEADWSAAALLMTAGHIADVSVRIAGLAPPADSLQGDAAFASMQTRLGDDDEAVRHFDLTDTPDLIAPLTAACLFADRPSRIRGARHARLKECDRVAVLCHELRKLGAELREHPDGLDLKPLGGVPRGRLQLDPADDHRMAMAFGVISLRAPGVSVANRDCVSKSFPRFWTTLDSIRARMGA